LLGDFKDIKMGIKSQVEKLNGVFRQIEAIEEEVIRKKIEEMKSRVKEIESDLQHNN